MIKLGPSLVILIASVRIAAADSADDLVAKGEAFAKDRRFTEAIDTFKAADKLERRARHACLIALAYARRELWSQAEVWRDECSRRAAGNDQKPEWFAAMTREIDERLVGANVAAVEIRVVPDVAHVELAVTSFSPDETFAPRTIHLAPGHHVITARARGYTDTSIELDVVDRSPRTVTISLSRPTRPPRGTALLYTGAVLGIAGAVTAGWMTFEYNQSRDSFDAWGDHIDNYRAARIATVGLWTAGAACAITGFILRRRGYSEAPSVAVTPTDGGAAFAVTWQR